LEEEDAAVALAVRGDDLNVGELDEER